MARLLIQNIEDDVRDGLRRRAERHGRGLEHELRDILRAAAAQADTASDVPLGARISARFKGIGLTEDIPEIRGQVVLPVTLDE